MHAQYNTQAPNPHAAGAVPHGHGPRQLEAPPASSLDVLLCRCVPPTTARVLPSGMYVSSRHIWTG